MGANRIRIEVIFNLVHPIATLLRETIMMFAAHVLVKYCTSVFRQKSTFVGYLETKKKDGVTEGYKAEKVHFTFQRVKILPSTNFYRWEIEVHSISISKSSKVLPYIFWRVLHLC